MERFVEEKSPEFSLLQRQYLLQLRKSQSCSFFEAGIILFWGGGKKNQCMFIVSLNPSLGICFHPLAVAKHCARLTLVSHYCSLNLGMGCSHGLQLVFMD